MFLSFLQYYSCASLGNIAANPEHHKAMLAIGDKFLLRMLVSLMSSSVQKVIQIIYNLLSKLVGMELWELPSLMPRCLLLYTAFFKQSEEMLHVLQGYTEYDILKLFCLHRGVVELCMIINGKSVLWYKLVNFFVCFNQVSSQACLCLNNLASSGKAFLYCFFFLLIKLFVFLYNIYKGVLVFHMLWFKVKRTVFSIFLFNMFKVKKIIEHFFFFFVCPVKQCTFWKYI